MFFLWEIPPNRCAWQNKANLIRWSESWKLFHCTTKPFVQPFIHRLTASCRIWSYTQLLLPSEKLNRSFMEANCVRSLHLSSVPDSQERKYINPLTPELNPSGQRCLARFLLGIFLLETCISLIYAWKPNKYTNYSFSLLIMYGSSYMFRYYIAILRESS
jgi:hypothetical protein